MEIVYRVSVPRNDEEWRIVGQRDGCEIVHYIVRQRIKCGVGGVRAVIAEPDGVPVRSRTSDPTGSDAAGGTRYILDDNGLAERSAHALSQYPRGGVRRPAGAKP